MEVLGSPLDPNAHSYVVRLSAPADPLTGLSHASRLSVQAIDGAVLEGSLDGETWGGLETLSAGDLRSLPPVDALRTTPADARLIVLVVH